MFWDFFVWGVIAVPIWLAVSNKRKADEAARIEHWGRKAKR